MSAMTRHLALLLALGTSALLTACIGQPSLEDAKKYNTPAKKEQAAPPQAPPEAPPQK
jgi:hypothetical protein